MKQSGLFPPVFVSFIIIVSISLSHLSAAVASWNNIDSSGSYSDSTHHLGDNPGVPMSDIDKFNTFKILLTTDSVQSLQNPAEIRGQHLFYDIFINDIFYVMPDDLLMLQINSQVSEWNNDVQSSSGLDDIVFKNNGDYIKYIRTPAPNSLLLVVIGLLSLRYTRSLRS